MKWMICSLALAICTQNVQALPQASINSEPSGGSNSLPTAFNSSVSSVQSTTTNALPDTTGSVHTSLETDGRKSSPPFANNSVEILKPAFQPAQKIVGGNIFAPIATGAPPPNIPPRADFPKEGRGIGIESHSGPLHTNKFYANIFLANQTHPVWTHPYSVAWVKGRNDSDIWGMSVSHIDRKQIVFGPEGQVPPQFYFNPLEIQSIVLDAAELGSSTVLTTDTHQAFSVNANLLAHAGGPPLISFPLVQGMGFVTAVYNAASIVLRSGVFFREVVYVGDISEKKSFKYRITLADGTKWLVYVTPNVAEVSGIPAFKLVDSTEIRGPKGFQGTIQVAKNPAGSDGEVIYDSAAGAYPISAALSGTTDSHTGTYSISWRRAGVARQMLLMFALPHHVESFVPDITKRITPIELMTTSKGMAKGVLSDTFVFKEPDLPVDIGFEPWSPKKGPIHSVSQRVATAVNNAARLELAQNMSAYIDLDSMYYAGKALSKYAQVAYTVNDLGTAEPGVAAAGLREVQRQFARFVNQKQILPLAYDTNWGGLVSSGGYGGDVMRDFGNTLYNDHHFHYGYFVHAAAIIAYLDPAWLDQGTNKAWVNSLIRDYANPVSDDPYFPFSRSFDWFHGHSWAKGVFSSADGKDEESSSEDAMSIYAIKMWGAVIGDKAMEERSNLQLAILKRSLNNYFYMKADNKNQPKEILPNMVTGILFENKVDHTTYFGSNISFIHGIHMLPLTPASPYMRPKEFVQQEWDNLFADGYVETVTGGWRGTLMANLALIDPKRSFEFFIGKEFENGFLDSQASRTWYLAWIAGLGGA
ncbi:glycoside hydrolase family protein [Venturia nashicola]|uniref:glucan endo-1,3-beta-D-glucosidase n=1 Tax=Venturia nashicola TaxID=86259 RepID=A0A4Z1NUM9_9PEZI|nr:glycoside hydrolase family 81 protein [Venturia nashicola]TLD27878.1 glycoside hydrolase family protein [Venturia nashicola]